VITHTDHGLYTLKSNAMGNLAVTKDAVGNFYEATFLGKATYSVPPWDPPLYCAARKCGDYKFTVYVEDRAEPSGTAPNADRFWIQVVPPAGAAPVPYFNLGTPAATYAKFIDGGNIQVPQPQSVTK
jgi:hypothetical protein